MVKLRFAADFYLYQPKLQDSPTERGKLLWICVA